MTPQQLELLVLAAVDRIKAGKKVEDDRIEVKGEWPAPTKARQLAGLANRARGEIVVYIIGIDEKTGVISSAKGPDVATWWPQMSSRFDSIPPEIRHHFSVPIGAGESVDVVVFATDRSPYLVKTDGGATEREIPIRDGTRTRSANRDELLRMLIPETRTPPAIVLDASCSGQWTPVSTPDQLGRVRPERTEIHVGVTIFLEHIGPDAIFLPLHEMSVELDFDGWKITPQVRSRIVSKDAPPPPTLGIDLRRDGIAATGPGQVRLTAHWYSDGDYRMQIQRASNLALQMRLGVSGATRPVRIDADLEQLREGKPEDGATRQYETLPRWSLAGRSH